MLDQFNLHWITLTSVGLGCRAGILGAGGALRETRTGLLVGVGRVGIEVVRELVVAVVRSHDLIRAS